MCEIVIFWSFSWNSCVYFWIFLCSLLYVLFSVSFRFWYTCMRELICIRFVLCSRSANVCVLLRRCFEFCVRIPILDANRMRMSATVSASVACVHAWSIAAYLTGSSDSQPGDEQGLTKRALEIQASSHETRSSPKKKFKNKIRNSQLIRCLTDRCYVNVLL